MNKLNVEMTVPMAMFTEMIAGMQQDYGKVAKGLYETMRKELHKPIRRGNARELEIIVKCEGFDGAKIVFNYDLEVYGK